MKQLGQYDEYKVKFDSMKKEDQKLLADENRIYEILRKRKYCAKKRADVKISSKKSVYTTRQGLSRATNKVKHVLPKSLGKIREDLTI